MKWINTTIHIIFLDFFFFFLFLFCCCLFSLFPLFLMLSGGDVRPLALVVIGRGQITTPYILVIPSEGDYCSIGRVFSSQCYVTLQPWTRRKHFHFGCPPPTPSPPPFFSSRFLVFLSFFALRCCSSSSSYCICLHVCSAWSVAGCRWTSSLCLSRTHAQAHIPKWGYAAHPGAWISSHWAHVRLYVFLDFSSNRSDFHHRQTIKW